MDTLTSASDKGRMLYHAIWEKVGANFFDTSRLGDWTSWEYRFDAEIDSEASALAFADQMLASLADPYTHLIVLEPQLLKTSVEPSPEATTPAQNSASAERPDVLVVLSPSNLGYVRIPDFDHRDVGDRLENELLKIASCDGVILDLRHNTGGMMHVAIDCCGFFLPDGLLTSLEYRHQDGIKQLQYFINQDQFFMRATLPDRSSSLDMYPRRPPLLAHKPIVILIDNHTASAAEMMVAALVQNGFKGKVTMVGTGTTPGKGIGQSELEIDEPDQDWPDQDWPDQDWPDQDWPDQDRTDSRVKVRVTTSHWRAPGGDWLGDCGQTVSGGIEPDILVEPGAQPDALEVGAEELRSMLNRLAESAQVDAQPEAKTDGENNNHRQT